VTTKIGFLAVDTDLDLGVVRLRVLAPTKDLLANLSDDAQMDKGWCYPPVVYRSIQSQQAQAPALVFALPSTHTIQVTGNAKEGKLDFLIACLSFLQGVRLVKPGEGHFYRVAVARGLLTDFQCTGATMARIMGLANLFWEQKPARASALLRGAIHWFLISQSYEHAFERFDG
jgi:hypothetical protein